MEGFYAISEMAHLFDLSRQTLIYYDRIGLFRPAYSNDEGYRFYAATQIPYLRLICLLKNMGVGLKEIASIMETRDTDAIVACLEKQQGILAERIAGLERTSVLIERRKRFYAEVAQWQELGSRPIIKHFPERFIIFEPWGVSGPSMNRALLHPALMRAIKRLHAVDDMAPVAGWGTMVLRSSFTGSDVLAGAGSFVTLPDDVDPARLTGVVMLPEGEYACQCRWGMPYDPEGVQGLLSWMREHRFEAAGNAFDFCLLDATSYTDRHSEDFCVMQIPLAF